MDKTYTLHGIHFEWDIAKAEKNVHKHQISFETASEIFFDPFVVVLEDELMRGEVREAVIGITLNWQLL